jgi:hypothetical protein
MTGEGRVLGEFTRYDQLLTLLRARIAELDVSGETLDAISGLPRGYFLKLVAPRPSRGLGVKSLVEVLGSLAVKCVLIEDTEQLELIRTRLVKRDSARVHSGAFSVPLTKRFMSKIARLSAQTRRANRRKRKMLEHRARNAALARWHGAAKPNGGTEPPDSAA